MNIIVLNSGSNGNAVYVESPASGAAVLLDCGISNRQIETRLKVHGRFTNSIRGVFITHEHGDHIRGVQSFSKHNRVPVYLTEQTYRNFWQRDGLKGFHFINPDGENSVAVEDISVRAFPKSHDAADPVFFLVEIGDKRFLYVTDLGASNERLDALIPTVDALMLESNYDSDMLWNGDYPEDLKERVDSELGHLSNEQAMTLLDTHAGGDLRLLIFAHISENNNTPEIVAREAEALLARKPGFTPRFELASRHTVSEVYTI
ncbi:MAG: MBL fold metallo-hydrolase [Ignavibacteriae bacterium]|nr:MBL fold metallo-hydrolase [Ignavibacteriota bacterium]